jgi:antitoxin HicB
VGKGANGPREARPDDRLRAVPAQAFLRRNATVAADASPAILRQIMEPPLDQSRTFAVVLEPEDEGGFTVRVPAFPEIVTYGKDEREALAMAEDAIRLVIADCARGEES